MRRWGWRPGKGLGARGDGIVSCREIPGCGDDGLAASLWTREVAEAHHGGFDATNRMYRRMARKREAARHGIGYANVLHTQAVARKLYKGALAAKRAAGGDNGVTATIATSYDHDAGIEQAQRAARAASSAGQFTVAEMEEVRVQPVEFVAGPTITSTQP